MLNPRCSATLPTMPSPVSAPELFAIADGLWIWHAYDPSVKAELFATAFAARADLYLVDPIPLAEQEFQKLAGLLAGVIVTNANHERAAPDYAGRLSVPILAHAGALAEINASQTANLSALASNGNIQVIEIEGAVSGEIAIYLSTGGGTLIVGDALINFEPYGFTFLPAKYCLDPKQMRRSLRTLLSFSFERMLFAHGTPIVSGARDRLGQLLEHDA